MRHLTKEQRYTIFVMKQQGFRNNQIANVIGKDKSVISRELKRNCDKRSGQYRAELAQRKYERRMKEKPKLIKFTKELCRLVETMLKEDYSPEQITGRCKLKGIKCVSCERIYQYIWEDKKRGGKLYRHLRHKGRRYRKRGATKDKRGIIKDRIGIEERPAIVEAKTRFGDLEFDTVIGKKHKKALLTINDRATNMCWLTLLEGKDAKILTRAVIEQLKPIRTLLHTATTDNGKEFAGHKDIATALGIDVYFAHPYHSWERGANENMNGLIRQYLPKGSSFEDLTDKDISFIQNRLNNRPRKKLGFLTPLEYFFANFATITNGLTDKLHL